MARKVGDMMTSVPIAVPPEATLVQAARFMDEYGVGEVLVIEDGRLCGVLTDRDIVIRGVAAERDASRTSVAAICNTDVVAVSPNDDAEIVARLMAEMAVRRVPVVEDDRLVGIASIRDLTVTDAASAPVT
jgi:CBS domain-containing protein